MNNFICSIKERPRFIEVPNEYNLVFTDIKTRQFEIEKHLIGKVLCSQINPSIYHDIKLNNYKIDIKKLDEILSSPLTLISGYHEFISCYINSSIEKDDILSILSPTQIEKIRDFIPSLKLFGGFSVEGLVGRPNVKNIANDIFVIKTPKNNKNNLIHEMMIGTLVLNNLKKYIPNFMYVYSYFNCSPIISYRNDVLTWCSSSGNSDVNYIVLENIKDSITMRDWASKSGITLDDFLSVFYQILNALNVAHFKYNYTHSDLHARNVLIRKFKNKIVIPFYNSKGKIIKYIVSNYIPYIIDYGFNYIKLYDINGKPYEFGLLDEENQSINYKFSFPMVDIHRLIIFTRTYFVRTKDNMNIVETIEKLFTFFSKEETLIERIRRRAEETDSSFPLDRSFSKYSYYDFIEWMEINDFNYNFVKSIDDIKNNKILLPNECNFIDIFTNSQVSAVEYCELMTNTDYRINNFEISYEEGNEIKNSVIFDSETNFIKDRGTMNSIKNYIDNITFGDIELLSDFSEEDVLEFGFVEEHERKILDLARVKEKNFLLGSLVKSNECVLIYQNNFKEEYRSYIKLMSDYVTNVKEIIEEQYDILAKNLVFVLENKYYEEDQYDYYLSM